MPDQPYTDAELEAGAQALDAWLVGLGMPPNLVQAARPYGAAGAVLRAVQPLHAARIREEAASELLHWRSEAAQLRQQLAVLRSAGVPTSVEHEQAHRELDAEFCRVAPAPEEGETRG